MRVFTLKVLIHKRADSAGLLCTHKVPNPNQLQTSTYILSFRLIL